MNVLWARIPIICVAFVLSFAASDKEDPEKFWNSVRAQVVVTGHSLDPDYGYHPVKPLRVGGFPAGPARARLEVILRERMFLKRVFRSRFAPPATLWWQHHVFLDIFVQI